MKTEKHIVLGVAGGLGRAVAKSLLQRNVNTIGVARDLTKAKKITGDLAGLELVQGDVFNPDSLDSLLSGATHVYYCVNFPLAQWEKVHTQTMAVIIEKAVKYSLKLIYPGNMWVYGKPQRVPITEDHPQLTQTVLGKIKDRTEKSIMAATREKGLIATIVRFPDFYGPYVINGFSEKVFTNALKGKAISWVGSLDKKTDLIFIEDAGEAMVIAGLSEKSNNMIFNVPGFKPITIRELLIELRNISGKSSSIKTINNQFLVDLFGLRDKNVGLYLKLLYQKQTDFYMSGELFGMMFNTLPATPYTEGLKKTLDWAKKYFLS